MAGTKTILFAGLCIAAYWGCAERERLPFGSEGSGEEGESAQLEIMPLSVGNIWTYQQTTPATGLTVSYEIEVLGREPLGSSEVFVVSYKSGGTWERSLFLSNETEGLYVFGTRSNEGVDTIFDEPRILMKYPASIHEKFASFDGENKELLANGKTVSTPLGTFQAMKYKVTRNGEWTASSYWQPGIGMVYHREFMTQSEGGGVKWQRAIVSYTLND